MTDFKLYWAGFEAGRADGTAIQRAGFRRRLSDDVLKRAMTIHEFAMRRGGCSEEEALESMRHVLLLALLVPSESA